MDLRRLPPLLVAVLGLGVGACEKPGTVHPCLSAEPETHPCLSAPQPLPEEPPPEEPPGDTQPCLTPADDEPREPEPQQAAQGKMFDRVAASLPADVLARLRDR